MVVIIRIMALLQGLQQETIQLQQKTKMDALSTPLLQLSKSRKLLLMLMKNKMLQKMEAIMDILIFR